MSQPPQEPGRPDPAEEPSWLEDEHGGDSTASVDDADKVARLEQLVDRLVTSVAQGTNSAGPVASSESERRFSNLEQGLRKAARILHEERERVGNALQSAEEDRQANAERFRRIEKAIAPPQEPAAPEEHGGPTPWSERATGQQWHDLAAWVDWMTDTYELRGHVRVYPCWPAHLGIVEELAALWASWREAAGKSVLDGLPAGDNDALVFWHDRYLAPTVARLQGLYLFQSCKDGHQTPVAAQKTDADLLPPIE